MSDIPLISVVLPVYNSAPYIAKAVESILAQTFTDFELIIVNDGSTDGTEAILRKFEKQDSRIRLISRPNTGYIIALNEALGLARGELVARMDGDDISLPRRFERQVAFLREHPDVNVVGGRVEIIDSSGRLILRPETPLHDAELQAALLEGRNVMGHPSIMARRQAIVDCGGYDGATWPAEDLDLWLRMGERGKLACVPQFVLRYREHEKSISALQHERQLVKAREACQRAWARRGINGRLAPINASRPVETASSRYDYAVRCGWWAFNCAQRTTAIHYAIRAIRLGFLREPGWKLLACALLKPMPQIEVAAQ
ncbi:MAG: glycosyltransferase [Phycisphaerae bacterium]|nr:glycosyltransferase [Phycisphaerae bacterium]